MDSSSESGGGDRRRRNNNRRGDSNNRNRNRSNNRGGQQRQGQRSRPSEGGDTYRPSGEGSASDSASSAKKKPGLFGKIVGFFKGAEPENKGTGRPIQTKRKRPGMPDEPAGGESATSNERSSQNQTTRTDGDRPKRKRTRNRSRRDGDSSEREGGGTRERRSEGGESRERRSGGGGGNRRGRRGERDGDRRGGGGGGGRDRGGRGNAHDEQREGDDRQPRTKREPRIVEVSSGRLYVGNLAYEVTDEELQDLFKGFGTVVSAEIVSNQRTDKSKGFAFVEMSTIDEAKRAVEILHDKDFMGRKITVTGATSEGPVDPDNPPVRDTASEEVASEPAAAAEEQESQPEAESEAEIAPAAEQEDAQPEAEPEKSE